MEAEEIKNGLRAALFSLESDKKINGIAGSIFQKKIEAHVSLILKNRKSKTFRRMTCGTSLEGLLSRRARIFGDIISLEIDTCYVPIGKRKQGQQNRSVTYCRVKVQVGDHQIESAPVTDTFLISEVQRLKHTRVAITGTVIQVPISSRRTKAVLVLDQIVESTSLLDFINPSKQTLAKARKYIEKHKGNLLDVLSQRLIRRFKIVNENSSRTTATILPEIALLVAAGQPFIGGKCGMIHVLTLGDPGGGKGFLLKILELLLVHFREVHGGRVTAPGFTASTKIDNETGAITTKKGALPLAHRGAVYLQDVHNIKNDAFAEISHTLSDQMEFGKVVISTSANTSHPAATSVVVDMNFKSRVDKKRLYSAHEDVRWENQMLSRFDIMAIIEPLSKDDRTIRGMAAAHLTKDAPRSSDDLMYKTVIALLHEMVPTVDVTPTAGIVGKRISSFYAANNVKTRESIEFDSSFNRLSKTVSKLITAHSRLHLRSEANNSDVDFAMRFVRMKFNALKMLEPAIKTNALKSPYLGPVERRQQWIVSRYSGKTVRSLNLTKKYNEKFPISTVDERTIKRDLATIAEPLGKGIWRVRPQSCDVKTVKDDKIDNSKVANGRRREAKGAR